MPRGRVSSKEEEIFLKGTVTVSFRRKNGLHMCTALEFSVIGFGKTKKKAFQEMLDLLGEYFVEVMNSDGPVAFYSPADAKEWNIKNQKHYNVKVTMKNSRKDINLSKEMMSFIESLRDYREDFSGIDLVPSP